MTTPDAPYQLSNEDLADWQRRVVDSSDPYLIVQAGPAAGKTYATLSAIAKRALEHPGSTCAYYGHSTHLYRAQDMLMEILARRMGTPGFQGTVRHNPLAVRLPNGSQVYFMSPDDLRRQGAGFEFRYAAVDLNAPKDVDALSARSEGGIAMTLGDHWQIVGPALETVPPASRNFFTRMMESVQPSSRNLFTKMMEADWTGEE